MRATFGILLGSQGVGAVLGALFVSYIRENIPIELAIRTFAVGTGLALMTIGLSHTLMFTCMGFFVIGTCNILTIALLNVSVQLSAPRWVTARALSLFLFGDYRRRRHRGNGHGASLPGGMTCPSPFVVSGCAVMATVLVGMLLPLTRDLDLDNSSVNIGYEPEVSMPLTLRSGPIVVEVEYDVNPERAREFYGVMMQVQGVRKRIGGFDWSISRDIENPAIWTERYQCPTWGDYLRMRDRYAQADFDLQAEADAFNRSGAGRRVRRRLARPFGSVRWKADSPDPYQETIGYIVP